MSESAFTLADGIALLISGAALTLSLVNFRLTGSFVRVKARTDMVMYSAEGKPLPGKFISLSAHNLGRTEVAVTGIGLVSGTRHDRSWGFTMPDRRWPHMGPELPFTLRPGRSQSWMIDMEDAMKKIDKWPVRAYVTLGNDKTRMSKPISID